MDRKASSLLQVEAGGNSDGNGPGSWSDVHARFASSDEQRMRELTERIKVSRSRQMESTPRCFSGERCETIKPHESQLGFGWY